MKYSFFLFFLNNIFEMIYFRTYPSLIIVFHPIVPWTVVKTVIDMYTHEKESVHVVKEEIIILTEAKYRQIWYQTVYTCIGYLFSIEIW